MVKAAMCRIFSVPNTPIRIHFGYHTVVPNRTTMVVDIINFIGYLPPFGKIVGIARIIFSSITYAYYQNIFFFEHFEKKACEAHFFRGVLEVSSVLSPVVNITLLIADILSSCLAS